MNTKKVVWVGEKGADDGKCDLCANPFGGVMYDASCRGLWGCFCEECFQNEGMRLGVGFGQKYEVNQDGDYVQTAGGQK